MVMMLFAVVDEWDLGGTDKIKDRFSRGSKCFQQTRVLYTVCLQSFDELAILFYLLLNYPIVLAETSPATSSQCDEVADQVSAKTTRPLWRR